MKNLISNGRNPALKWIALRPGGKTTTHLVNVSQSCLKMDSTPTSEDWGNTLNITSQSCLKMDSTPTYRNNQNRDVSRVAILP